jgi:hypothetical protein
MTAVRQIETQQHARIETSNKYLAFAETSVHSQKVERYAHSRHATGPTRATQANASISSSTWRASREEHKHLQLGDVAEGDVVLDGALALDGRVEVVVVFDDGAVRGDAGAGVAADVPCRRRCLVELGEHRVHRRRCKKTGLTPHIHSRNRNRAAPAPRPSDGPAVIGRPGISAHADIAEPAKANSQAGGCGLWTCGCENFVGVQEPGGQNSKGQNKAAAVYLLIPARYLETE